MKKTILSLTIFLGVFFVAGMASASDVETLQPASAITYNEDLTVNGTGRFDSVYIGKQDIGGVTFFNGTIVNSTTGDGDSDNPVTFGDGVRIDGLIWGGPNKGNVTDQALKIADTLLPGLTNINDLGSSSLRWDKIYANNGDFSGKLKVEDVIAENVVALNSFETKQVAIGGGFGSSGVDINSAGEMKIDGDIIQSKNSNGVLKAAAYCNMSNSSNVWYDAEFYFNNLKDENNKIYCFKSANPFDKFLKVRLGESGEVAKYNLKNRFIQVLPINTGDFSNSKSSIPRKVTSDSNVVTIDSYRNNIQYYNDFMIFIY